MRQERLLRLQLGPPLRHLVWAFVCAQGLFFCHHLPRKCLVLIKRVVKKSSGFCGCEDEVGGNVKRRARGRNSTLPSAQVG